MSAQKNPRGTGKHHNPSFYRSLIREKKRKKSNNILSLITKAKTIDDPYYSSLALFRLSGTHGLGFQDAVEIAKEAVELAENEKRDWRLAELVVELSKFAPSWRKWEKTRDTMEFRDVVQAKIVDLISRIPQGKHRSEAIQGLANKLPGTKLDRLIKIAAENKGNELDDVKSLIRAWAKKAKQKSSTPDLTNMVNLITQSVRKNFTRAKVLGYLHLQVRKAKLKNSDPKVFSAAVESASNIEEQDKKLAAFRYLTRIAWNRDELLKLRKKTEEFEKLYPGVRLLCTLAGRADKHNHPGLAQKWFLSAVEYAEELNEPWERILARQNLAEGIARCGNKTDAVKLYKKCHLDLKKISIPEKSERMKEKIQRSMRKVEIVLDLPGIDEKKTERTQQEDNFPEKIGSNTKRNGRHILALYDTYQGGLKSTHYRAVARAAPLCIAFDLKLALLEFPGDNVEELIENTIKETNIGKGGKYLRLLLKENRVSLISEKSIEKLEENIIKIATTSHPEKNKNQRLEWIIPKIRKEGLRIFLVMGLGRKGLPAYTLRNAEYHLELTGEKIPLETCTAMGVMAERLRSLSEKIPKL